LQFKLVKVIKQISSAYAADVHLKAYLTVPRYRAKVVSPFIIILAKKIKSRLLESMLFIIQSRPLWVHTPIQQPFRIWHSPLQATLQVVVRVVVSTFFEIIMKVSIGLTLFSPASIHTTRAFITSCSALSSYQQSISSLSSTALLHEVYDTELTSVAQ